MSSTDPLEQNILGVQSLVGDRTNKIDDGVLSFDEGESSEKINVLALDLDDAELLALTVKWTTLYAPYEAKISRIQKANKMSYLGKVDQSGPIATYDAPQASNYQFEAEETFLAAAFAKNPDPVVYADNSDIGNKLADDVKVMLQFHADQLLLRRKLQDMVRQWSIYHLGVLKYGWDDKIKDISVESRKIQDFIFDPNGFVDAYGDFESWMGERITVTAEKLCQLFPKHRAFITLRVEGKMGTDCVYTEWWTDEYCFSTFKEVVLDKHKNEFFKYDEPQVDPMTQQPAIDPMTSEPVMTKARNHFARPKKPYTFLSVFSLREQPHDVTGLIEQNIPNQKRISKRADQIDLNLSRANNSDLFSEENFNQQTAKQAANALDGKGSGKVLIPPGQDISKAIVRLPAPGISDSYFKELESNIEGLRSSWGVQGITAQQPKEDTTARGMILNQQYDNTRIGGGIGESVAQVASNSFNWFVQLYYVYYDEPHFAAVVGQLKATEYVTLSAQSLTQQLVVTVAPDSMKPKDELTTINQAVEYYQMGAIGPKTLLTIANFPNPDESAADGVLWQVDKNAYIQLNFPELAKQLQQIQQQAMQAQAMAQQQQLQQQGAEGQQKIGQSEQAHQQKMRHGDESHKQKLAQQEQKAAQFPTTAVPPAGASLSSVPIPK